MSEVENIIARRRAWYAKHRDIIRARQRAWRIKHEKGTNEIKK